MYLQLLFQDLNSGYSQEIVDPSTVNTSQTPVSVTDFEDFFLASSIFL